MAAEVHVQAQPNRTEEEEDEEEESPTEVSIYRENGSSTSEEDDDDDNAEQPNVVVTTSSSSRSPPHKGTTTDVLSAFHTGSFIYRRGRTGLKPNFKGNYSKHLFNSKSYQNWSILGYYFWCSNFNCHVLKNAEFQKFRSSENICITL